MAVCRCAMPGPDLRERPAGHMREGVVVRPLHERNDPDVGRVILKSISPDYLLRNGGTELH